MGILQEDVARVRESTDVVALIGEQVALKRASRRFQGLCPFHSEKTPSFSVNPELGLYFCFGCNKSGDAITFVRETENLDFVGAVERLAARANISLRYDDPGAGKSAVRRQRLVDAVQAAVDFYSNRLISSDDAGLARKFVRSRGFDGGAVRRFSLGFSPSAFDELSRSLQDKKFSRQDLVDSGLAFVNRAQKLQDVFRGRLMFPIFDSRGDAIAFGGRKLGGDGPKYKNSSESALYHKSRVLYGLNWAKGEIVSQDQVVICEGYSDVIGLHLAGVQTAVATCGTALADEHVAVLKNLTRKVVLAYDSDAAGQGAAVKWLAWEATHGLELYVAKLPPGKDPGDMWRESPEGLKDAVSNAIPFMAFRVDRVLQSEPASSPEAKSRLVEAVVPILRDHPSEIVRDGYVSKVAGALDIDPSHIKDRLRGIRRVRQEAVASEDPVAQIDLREVEALRLAIHYPELVVHRLDEELFSHPRSAKALRTLLAADTFNGALESADAPTRVLFERLAVEEPDAGEQLEVYVAELLGNLAETAGRRFQRRLVTQGNPRASQVSTLLDRLVGQRNAGDWAAVDVSTKQLVAWLVEPVSEEL